MDSEEIECKRPDLSGLRLSCCRDADPSIKDQRSPSLLVAYQSCVLLGNDLYACLLPLCQILTFLPSELIRQREPRKAQQVVIVAHLHL
jgi:hypothetical protein